MMYNDQHICGEDESENENKIEKMISVEVSKDIGIINAPYSICKWSRDENMKVSGKTSDKYKYFEYKIKGNVWERTEEIKDYNTIQWRMKVVIG